MHQPDEMPLGQIFGGPCVVTLCSSSVDAGNNFYSVLRDQLGKSWETP